MNLSHKTILCISVYSVRKEYVNVYSVRKKFVWYI